MSRASKLFLLLLALAVFGWSQAAQEANKDYATPEGRARIMKLLADSHRTDRLRPSEIVAALSIKNGDTVADVGTGVGMMLPYLCEAVSTAGRVIAQDIHQDFLDAARARAQSEKLTNVTFLVGTDRNPGLPDRQVDLVLMLDVYHHFDYPAEMLRHIGRALTAGGRVAIVDFYRHRRDADGGEMSKHVRADKDEVLREVRAAGYELLSQRDHGANQYILILKKQI
jgi:ubiquinone/menaquinone biosynthesis C-methylase UbiE